MSIDFEKLKYVHEFADKWSKENGRGMQINAFYGANCNTYHLIYKLQNLGFLSLDELIDHIEELKLEKPKPKYVIGQQIWFIDINGTINSMIIDEIDYRHPDGFYYKDKKGDYISDKDKTYRSRKSLIDAQIEYWQNMKDESVTNCQEGQHESDGHYYKIQDDDEEPYNPDFPFNYKCKKCGEFYR